MQRTADVVPQAEKLRLGASLADYLAWLDRQADDALVRYDPAKVWSRFYVGRVEAEVRAEVAEKLRRDREVTAEAASKTHWEAADRKLDEALDFLKTRVWRVREPYTIEDRESGVGYLVWESAQESAVRDLIGRGFLRDVIASMHHEDFTRTSVAADFQAWLAAHPAEYEAYLLAQAYPDTEKYEIRIDIPAWQTAIEVGIGFIPVVGSIVAAGEAAFGYDLFGNKLSTVDRAVLAASVLLPAAAKVYKAGRASVTVATLARDYRLSAREADVAYRALTQVRPGTAGARVLESAVADVRAGSTVRDAKRLNELDVLFKDMGWTDRATARELRAGAAESAMQGHAGRPGQEVADLFATGDEVAELTGAIEGRASRAGRHGGTDSAYRRHPCARQKTRARRSRAHRARRGRDVAGGARARATGHRPPPRPDAPGADMGAGPGEGGRRPLPGASPAGRRCSTSTTGCATSSGRWHAPTPARRASSARPVSRSRSRARRRCSRWPTRPPASWTCRRPPTSPSRSGASAWTTTWRRRWRRTTVAPSTPTISRSSSTTPTATGRPSR
ncbi:pre-toxin TG domain-containing protein [Nonomuraea ferruginea]